MKIAIVLIFLLLVPFCIAIESFENPSQYIKSSFVNMTSPCAIKQSFNNYWHNRTAYYNVNALTKVLNCQYTNGAWSYGAPQNNATPYMWSSIEFTKTLYVSNISILVCGNNTTPNKNADVYPSGALYNTLAMKEFSILCSSDNITFSNILNASPHFRTSNISTLFFNPTCNATKTCYPPRCENNVANPNNFVYYTQALVTPRACKYLRIGILGNDFYNGTGIGSIFMSGTLAINDLPVISGITNTYTLFPQPLSGDIIASDTENDTLYYAYICDVYNTNVSTSTANVVNARLNPSKLISDYNQPLDSNGAYACFGYSCGVTDYLYDYCLSSQSYGSKQYRQCPNTDEFRTTSYAAAFEESQAYYGIRVNENSSFLWLLSNVDASKELSWRGYPGWNPRPLTYAFLVWDSSYLLSLAYRWQYNSSNARYVLYKTFAVNPSTNDTFNETIGSFSLSSLNNPDSNMYPDIRFIMKYNYGINLSFYVQDTATNELLYVGIDNLSKNAFNQSFVGSNYRFSSIMFKPHNQATAFYAFKQNALPISIEWLTTTEYSCAYEPGTYTFRALVTDSEHINSSYSYADFLVTSDNIGAQAVSSIISRFVDFSDANAVKRFLVIYQVFMIIAVLVVSLLIYFGFRSLLPEISAWVFVGISLILLYVASLTGLLLAWTGVLCSIVFAVTITSFLVRNVSGGSQSNAVMGLGLLCYFAIIFITVGWLGQVSGSYGTFEPVQVPQGLLPDYNQTNSEQGFWSSLTTLSSQILSLIYTFLSFIGRFFAVVSFAVVNIPFWLAVILNVMQGGMLIWGFMYLRGNN